MTDRRRSVRELDTAARIRPLVIGSFFAVFMCTVLTLAVIVLLGNNAVLDGPVVAGEKGLAVVGKSVRGPDQWPQDGQNPSDARQGVFSQFCLRQ